MCVCVLVCACASACVCPCICARVRSPSLHKCCALAMVLERWRMINLDSRCLGFSLALHSAVRGEVGVGTSG